MCPFIETILAEYGEIKALEFHQERLNETLLSQHSRLQIDLHASLSELNVPMCPKCKIRVQYTTEGIERIDIAEYVIKKLKSFSLVDIGKNEYPYKFADRQWIYELLAHAGTDEMIMVKNGMITDASIANLAFFNGVEWHTPQHPLLKGTRRKALLDAGIIETSSITPENLPYYSSFKLINAMINWEDSPMYSVKLIEA